MVGNRRSGVNRAGKSVGTGVRLGCGNETNELELARARRLRDKFLKEHPNEANNRKAEKSKKRR